MSAAKVLFAGTPAFALASLSALCDAGYRPQAVLTQPDRPAGRGRKLTASPVKVFAAEAGIDTWQPATLRDQEVVAAITALDPDIIVVAAYGLLLPKAVLEIPRRGCLNVHASLLPRWRGAAPIQQAILAGDTQTGISLMHMDEGLDTGPVFASRALSIGADETAGELHDRLAALGGTLLAEMLPAILAGELAATPQDDEQASYAAKIRKRDASINWNLAAEQIARCVRAYNPVPGANFEFGDEVVRCLRARVVDGDHRPPGTVVAAGRDGVDVACGDGVLRILEVQRPGRRAVSAADFAAQLKPAGQRFGWIS